MSKPATVEFIQLSERSRWQGELEKFGSRDVYFTAQFHALQQDIDKARAECAVVHRGAESLFVPYLISPIPGSDAFDVQSAYGYAGPLVGLPQTVSSEFVHSAWRDIEASWHERGVVAAFFRCHPVIRNSPWFPSSWNVVYDRPTVAVDLKSVEEPIFAHPQQRKHRRDVGKTLRLGATVEKSCALKREMAIFKRLYFETMDRLGAARGYYFNDSYFDRIVKELGEDCMIYRILDAGNGAWLAAALILRGEEIVHYHLGARVQDESNLNFFHLLFDTVARDAAAEGFGSLHLGGGRSTSPDDSLLSFKRRVGTRELEFYTARRVIDARGYRTLMRSTPNPSPGKFLGYR